MAQPVRTDSIPGHAERKAKAKDRARARAQKKDLEADLSNKTFGELTGKEKDDLLKAVALELNLIAPDP